MTTNQETKMSPMEIEHSPEIKALADALSKAQGEIQDPMFDSENPHYESRYASLAVILHAIRTVFSKHGLAMVQAPFYTDGQVGCVTMIMHVSGQWMRGRLAMKPDRPTPHGVGSALTYAKRYSAYAFGLIAGCPDDDANAAEGLPARPRAQRSVSLAVDMADAEAEQQQRCNQAWDEVFRSFRIQFPDANLTYPEVVARGTDKLIEMNRPIPLTPETILELKELWRRKAPVVD